LTNALADHYTFFRLLLKHLRHRSYCKDGVEVDQGHNTHKAIRFVSKTLTETQAYNITIKTGEELTLHYSTGIDWETHVHIAIGSR